MDLSLSFVDPAHNGRSEENENSQPMDVEEIQSEENENSQPMDVEEIQLKREVEMIQKVLIETGVLERIKDFMIRKLNNTDWKDKMVSASKEFFKDKENSKISFDQIYDGMKEKGKSEIDEELKIQALNQMKICYRSSVNN